ncbi:MAG: ATP-binding protein [Verrucomicrobiota bacterium]|nr:ATP-binding protein [Verrucomicrobiota bacterium]
MTFVVNPMLEPQRDQQTATLPLPDGLTEAGLPRCRNDGITSPIDTWRVKLDVLDEPAYIRDTLGMIRLVNNAFISYFGRRDNYWVGQTVQQIITPAHQSQWKSHLERTSIDPVRTLELECETVRGVRWLRWQEMPCEDSGGPLIIGIGRDFTREYRAETQSYLLSQAIEQCPIDIALANLDGRMLYANRSLSESLNCSLEDIISGKMLLPGFEKLEDSAIKLLVTQIRTGQSYRNELSITQLDGTIHYYSFQITGIQNIRGKVTHLLMLKENITDRKVLEEQVRTAQKMESIGILAGGIAHDFNNLLGVIIGYSELATRTPDNPEKIKTYLREIHRASSRAVNLVRQILTFSRKDEVIFVTVDLNQSVRELANMFRETFPRTIGLQLELAPNLPKLNADANQIQQILINLCVNAKDAMPKGGILTISTRPCAGTELVKLGADTATTYAMLEVADTGQGMPPEVRKRIFEPFYTTKEKGHGTGLGLAVVDGIISRHHGFIEVDSAMNQGTTFRIYLPTQLKGVEHANDEEQDYQNSCAGKRILIVDDENGLRDLLHSVLEENDFLVEEASNGLDAVIRLQQPGGDPIHAVMLDYNMGVMNGWETFQRIRQFAPTMPIVIMSGYLTPEIKQCFVRYGQRFFLNKPYSLDKVLSMLSQLFEESTEIVQN